jgi:hypothetical protein
MYLRDGAAGEDLDGLDEPLDFEAVVLPVALSHRKLGEVLLQLCFILGRWVVAEQQRQGHIKRLSGRDGLVESNRAGLLFDAGNSRWIDVCTKDLGDTPGQRSLTEAAAFPLLTQAAGEDVSWQRVLDHLASW